MELLNVSLAQFQSFLPDDTATWFYNIIRGVERSPVTPKSSIKSMLSAKSFRDPLPSSIADCSSWLNIFVCDIMSRLEEEGVMEGKRRPKTMGLYIRDKAGSRSRQTSMPGGGRIGKEALLKLAEGLLQQVAGDGAGSWPCVGLSIQISGFEDREEGNQGIGGFLVKGGGGPKEVLKRPEGPCIALPQEKKRRTEPGIGRYFSAGPVVGEVPMPIEDLPDQDTFHELEEDSAESEDIPVFPCTDCGADIRIGDEEEHADWHFAKALVAQDRLEREKEREKERASQPPPPQSRGRGGSAKARGKKDTKKLEKGQLKLAF